MDLKGPAESTPTLREASLDTTPGVSVFRLTTRRLAIVVFFISAAVMFLYRPFSQAERGDPAIWDYVAQSVLRGQVPYRDVVEIKSPLSAYLSAAAIATGRMLRVRDFMAVRLLNILLVGLLSLISYSTAEAYLKSRAAAFIAFLFPLMSTSFARLMIGGTQPKLGMSLFGLLTLLLIAKERPFWAGVFSMLSCLCWQPGLLFTGTAVLVFSRYLTTWRDGRALKVMLGALIPLAVLVVYFFWVGALADLWSWTVVYNFTVYAPSEAKPVPDALSHFWKIARQTFEADIVLVLASGLGMAVYLVDCFRARRPANVGQPQQPYQLALLIPPVVYLAFCLIDFQGAADLIPIFPFIGLFLGWLVVRIVSRLMSLDVFKPRSPRLTPAMASFVVAASIAFFVFTRAAQYRIEPDQTLASQEAEISRIGEHLGPNDKIYVHGTVEILVLLDRANMNPYIMWDNHKNDYVAARSYGGSFKSIIAEMESEAPKLVAFSRLRMVQHSDELEAWVEEHYDRLALIKYDRVFLRKERSEEHAR